MYLHVESRTNRLAFLGASGSIAEEELLLAALFPSLVPCLLTGAGRRQCQKFSFRALKQYLRREGAENGGNKR